jgi:hypothetical protein
MAWQTGSQEWQAPDDGRYAGFPVLYSVTQAKTKIGAGRKPRHRFQLVCPPKPRLLPCHVLSQIDPNNSVCTQCFQ